MNFQWKELSDETIYNYFHLCFEDEQKSYVLRTVNTVYGQNSNLPLTDISASWPEYQSHIL